MVQRKERYGAAEFIRAEHISLFFVVAARLLLNPQTNSTKVFWCRFFTKKGQNAFYKKLKKLYLPNRISITFMSAGDTPGMRDAWPSVLGRILVSFCRDYIVRD